MITFRHKPYLVYLPIKCPRREARRGLNYTKICPLGLWATPKVYHSEYLKATFHEMLKIIFAKFAKFPFDSRIARLFKLTETEKIFKSSVKNFPYAPCRYITDFFLIL